MFVLRSPHNGANRDDASPAYSSLSFQVLNAFRRFECLQLNSVNDSIINDGTITAKRKKNPKAFGIPR